MRSTTHTAAHHIRQCAARPRTPKRYRFTGKERDEETGLAYHGARYYAPWLGRWVSGDPAGLTDGVNLYLYVNSNPVGLIDPTGTDGQTPDIAHMERRLREIGAEITKTKATLARFAAAEAKAKADLAELKAAYAWKKREVSQAREALYNVLHREEFYQADQARICAQNPDSCLAAPTSTVSPKA